MVCYTKLHARSFREFQQLHLMRSPEWCVDPMLAASHHHPAQMGQMLVAPLGVAVRMDHMCVASLHRAVWMDQVLTASFCHMHMLTRVFALGSMFLPTVQLDHGACHACQPRYYAYTQCTALVLLIHMENAVDVDM